MRKQQPSRRHQRPHDDGALYETSRGFLLPDEWDPAPLLRGATTWKKHKRKPPSLDADGRVVEVGPYPNRNPRAYPAHIDPHAARLGCGVFRIASHPHRRPNPQQTHAHKPHTYDDPNL